MSASFYFLILLCLLLNVVLLRRSEYIINNRRLTFTLSGSIYFILLTDSRNNNKMVVNINNRCLSAVNWFCSLNISKIKMAKLEHAAVWTDSSRLQLACCRNEKLMPKLEWDQEAVETVNFSFYWQTRQNIGVCGPTSILFRRASALTDTLNLTDGCLNGTAMNDRCEVTSSSVLPVHRQTKSGDRRASPPPWLMRARVTCHPSAAAAAICSLVLRAHTVLNLYRSSAKHKSY